MLSSSTFIAFKTNNFYLLGVYFYLLGVYLLGVNFLSTWSLFWRTV